jgi:hypothetical protein
MSDKRNSAQFQVICTVCGDDVQQADGHPVKIRVLPAELRWQEAPTPQDAIARVRKALATGPKFERVLCARCARLGLLD